MSRPLPPGYESRTATPTSGTCRNCVALAATGIHCNRIDMDLPVCDADEYYIRTPISAKDQLHSALVKAGIIDR